MVKTALKRSKGKHPDKRAFNGKTPGLLTEKQAEFARQIVAGKSQIDSYRLAYLPPEDSKPETLAILAHRVARRPAVGAYVAKLRSRSDRSVLLSLNDRLKIAASIITDPETKPSDRLTGIAVYSRISGDQAPDRTEHTGKDGGPIQTVGAVVELPGTAIRRLPARQRLLALRAAREAREGTAIEIEGPAPRAEDEIAG